MVKSNLTKNLKPEDVIAVQDSREQRPVDLSPLKVIVKKLDVADYSVEGFEDMIAIERKSLSDMIGCITHERERFERMLEKLSTYPYKAIVIEADWANIDLKQYRGQTHQNSIYGTLMAWAMSYNVSLLFSGDASRAGKMIARGLWVCANRIHRYNN